MPRRGGRSPTWGSRPDSACPTAGSTSSSSAATPDAGGSTGHILDRIDPSGHRILVTDRNFGSGSSREHAPWALADYGFRVVIALSIADIFGGNAIRNGLLPIVLPGTVCDALGAPNIGEVTVDLVQSRLTAAGLAHDFVVEPFARRCLMEGRDAIGWMLGQSAAIAAYEARGAA